MRSLYPFSLSKSTRNVTENHGHTSSDGAAASSSSSSSSSSSTCASASQQRRGTIRQQWPIRGRRLRVSSRGCMHIRPKNFFSGPVCMQGKGHLAPPCIMKLLLLDNRTDFDSIIRQNSLL